MAAATAATAATAVIFAHSPGGFAICSSSCRASSASANRSSRFFCSRQSTKALSLILRAAISGHAQHYGLFMAAGIIALLTLAVLLS